MSKIVKYKLPSRPIFRPKGLINRSRGLVICPARDDFTHNIHNFITRLQKKDRRVIKHNIPRCNYEKWSYLKMAQFTLFTVMYGVRLRIGNW